MEPLRSNKELRDFPGFFDSGDWFAMPEDEVFVAGGERSGRHFAEGKAHSGWGGRRVVTIMKPSGPSTVVRARTSDVNGNHQAHDDCCESCKIDLVGQICWDVPATVKTSLFTLRYFSCREEEQIVLNNIEEL